MAEPLRTLMAELEREAHEDSTTGAGVQFVGVVSVRAAANTNRNPAPSTRGHGARTAA